MPHSGEREREKKNTKTHTKRRMPDINSPHSSNTPRLLRRHPHRIPLIIPRHKTRIVDFDNRPVRRSIYIRKMLTRCICRRYKTGSQFSSKRQKKRKKKGDEHDISIHRIIIYKNKVSSVVSVSPLEFKKPPNNDHKNSIPQKTEHQNNPSQGHTGHSKLLPLPNTKRVPKVST